MHSLGLAKAFFDRKFLFCYKLLTERPKHQIAGTEINLEDLKKPYRTTALISSAIIASLFIYIVVTVIIKAQYVSFEGFASSFNLTPLRYGLYVLALIQLMIIIKIRGILFKKTSFENIEEVIIKLSRTSIITSALCEVPALFGLILFLLGGSSRDFYILVIWSGFLFLLYFPRYSNWEKWAKSVR